MELPSKLHMDRCDRIHWGLIKYMEFIELVFKYCHQRNVNIAQSSGVLQQINEQSDWNAW